MAQNYVEKSEITYDEVKTFIAESDYLFKTTGQESAVEIIFNTGKTLDDIVGKYNTKKDAENIVRQIKNGTIGTRGFIIYSQDGSVGAGRCHTAKAIAGEAKIPFVSINASDFSTKEVSLFDSHSQTPEAAIKKLFSLVSTQAETNEYKSAVLFIENFEDFSAGSFYSEYNQKAMAQLIREMRKAREKGFNIVVIGSICNPNWLDNDTIKSSEFKSSIEVSSPMCSRDERKEILEHMIKESGIKLAGSEKEKEKLIQLMAKILDDFSFREIKEFVSKSRDIAIEYGHESVNREDMVESYLRQVSGRTIKSTIPQHEKMITTKHECGHALTMQIMNNLMHRSGKEWRIPNTLAFLALDPRANFGGVTYNITDTNDSWSFEREFTRVVSCYGGHSAENKFFGMDGSWGITGDLYQATSEAEEMVELMGMGHNTGKISVANIFNEKNFERNITPALRRKIEKDVEVITKNALLASDMIVEYYSDFINEFAERYADRAGTGDCLIDGDQFRKELADWKAKQSPAKLAELDVLDKILLDIIDNAKNGKLY